MLPVPYKQENFSCVENHDEQSRSTSVLHLVGGCHIFRSPLPHLFTGTGKSIPIHHAFEGGFFIRA
jgi:hypothetical protein